MTVEIFLREFPMLAANLTVGVTTTVQYNGRAHSFRKVAPGEIEEC